ncbi:hypothetical protein HI914_03168 [Erysiphe necator]|nr:hypothetical protein HI914_03168 [Erysiphe necator]
MTDERCPCPCYDMGTLLTKTDRTDTCFLFADTVRQIGQSSPENDANNQGLQEPLPTKKSEETSEIILVGRFREFRLFRCNDDARQDTLGVQLTNY